MIKILKVYKVEIVAVLFIIAIYFSLRLPNLILQPIFADEAIYIRWAQVMRAEPTLRFLPLSDGKTPLFMWTMIPFFKFFNDPLYAGRFLSIMSGLGTLLGALFLGWKFFNSKVGLLSALLVAVVPFMVFFDRMALVDSMLAAFSIWSLNLALLLIKYPRLDLAMVLGYVMGGGLLTKPPAMFNILVIPTTLIIFNWRDRFRQIKLLKIFGFWLITFALTFAIYNILRLGPGFSSINSRNQDYVFSPWEIKDRILDPFLPHLRDMQDWLPKLLTFPVLITVFGGVALTLIKRDRYAVVILLWSSIPLITQTFFLKTFTARYILFSIPPLLCLGGWAIFLLIQRFGTRKYLAAVILIILLVLPLRFNLTLITDPSGADLPRSERRGYLEEWTAGYGLKEIAGFLIAEAKKGTIVVGTEGSFGTLPDGLQIYLDNYFHYAPKDEQIIVIGGRAEISNELRKAALSRPTYFISNRSRFYDADDIKIIKEYPKTKGPTLPQDAMLLFKVLPTTSKPK